MCVFRNLKMLYIVEWWKVKYFKKDYIGWEILKILEVVRYYKEKILNR